MIPSPSTSSTFAPAVRVSRAEELARHLEDEIVAGNLEAGERLGTKDELRRRYSLAMSTINEAVRLLDTRGLITARTGPGGGVFVAEPASRVRLAHLVLGFGADDRPFSDCLQIRNALEPLVCTGAFERCRARDAVALRRLISEMQACTDSPAAFLAINWNLHRRLARMCANAALTTIYLTLIDFVEAGLSDVRGDEQFDGDDNLEIHSELVEAVIDSDRDRLRRAIERHTPIADRWVESRSETK